MSESSTIVSAVFEEFLKQLEEKKTIEPDGLVRLRDALLSKRDYSQENLRKALFGEEVIK